MTTGPNPPEQPPARTRPKPAARVLPSNPKVAGIVVVAFTALLYLVELADLVIPGNLETGGIQARSVAGLDGIAWSPLLHGSWGHLFGNTVPVLVFGFLAMASGVGQWVAVTLTVWIIGGLGVWVAGSAEFTTIGASGLAFGWLAFLLVRGVFNRSVAQLLVAAVLLFVWGGMLWGVLPGNPGISWQGHLFGALGGVLAAWITAKADRARAAKQEAPPTAPGTLAG